jgi:hypothetical protein
MVRLRNRLLRNKLCRLVLHPQMLGTPVARPVPGAQSLTRPTERPSEPITAGANFGAGPNAMQAGLIPRMIPEDPVLDELRTLYSMFPNDDLANLLSKYGESKF